MKPKVAIFRSQLLPISETFIRDQASSLKTWEPILFGHKESKEGLSTPGVRREIVESTGNRFRRTFRFWFQQPDPKFVERLKQSKVSLVHVHFGTDATRIWPSVKAANLPMLVTLHGQDINTHKEWWESGRRGLQGRVYPRRLLEMSKDRNIHFIAVSKAIKERAKEYGIPEDKITLSYIGVDTERFKPGGLPIEQRSKRILFVGRMVEKKAPLLMIEVYAKVLKQIPDAELVMVGAGPLLDEAKQLANTLEMNIQFLGSCTSSEVISQLHHARCFCLPSITARNGDAEGLGMVILEAQSCGIPVVTSARGGSIEGIIPGKTGHSFSEGNVEQATAQLIKVLSCDKLAPEFYEAIGLTRKKFNILTCTEHLETIYSKSVLEKV